MQQILFSLVFIMVSVTYAGQTYGSKIDTTNAVSIDKVLAQPSDFVKKDILVTGEINKVCQSKGCWFEFATKTEPLRVTFKNYDFTIPKDSQNKKVLAHGQLVQKEVSVATQRHYLKDAKASKEEIAAVKAPKMAYEFIADGVVIN